MPRRKGPHGPYGKHGSTTLAKRLEIEAANPGFRLCRHCEALIPSSDVLPSAITPYCFSCRQARYRKTKKPPSESEPAKLLLRNAALKKNGTFWCRHCDTEKPLSERPGEHSRCRGCMNDYLRSWSRRKRHKPLEIGPSLRPAKSFGTKLTFAVSRVFRHLGVMDCKHHGWQELSGQRCIECLQRRELRRLRRKEKAFVEPVTIHELYRRSGGVCYLCRRKVSGREASVDHVMPLAKGGKHSYSNCRLAHRLCNSIKRDTGPLVAMCDPRIAGVSS